MEEHQQYGGQQQHHRGDGEGGWLTHQTEQTGASGASSSSSPSFSPNRYGGASASGRGEEAPVEYGIFVSDIARGVTDQQLKDAFSAAGVVTNALVVKNKFTGETKGFGFVHFATLEAVHNALDMAELPSFCDCVSSRVQTVKVVRADPKNVLFVGNVPRGLSEESVRQALQEVTTAAYEVTKFKLCTTPEGSSKGYGWATFRDHKCAVQAMRFLQTTPVFGLYLNVHMVEPRNHDEDLLSRVKSLFVRGITPTTSTEALKAFFGDGCEKVIIPLDTATKSVLGHAFVHFATRQQAEIAMQRCQNATLEGETQPLSVEWCLPKDLMKNRGRGGGRGEWNDYWDAPPPYYGGGPHGYGGYGGSWEEPPPYYDDSADGWGAAYGAAYGGRGGYDGFRGGRGRGGHGWRGRGGGYGGGYGGGRYSYGTPPSHYYGGPPPLAGGYSAPPASHYAPHQTTPSSYTSPSSSYAATSGYNYGAQASANVTATANANGYAGYTAPATTSSGYAGNVASGAYDTSQTGYTYSTDYSNQGGYYGSPAGGKALVPRDNARYNPY